MAVKTAVKPVAKPTTPKMTEPNFEHLAGIYRALADPNRLRILNHLATTGGEMSQIEIVRWLPSGLGQPTVAWHLGVLVRAGLLRRRREANQFGWSATDVGVLCCRFGPAQ